MKCHGGTNTRQAACAPKTRRLLHRTLGGGQGRRSHSSEKMFFLLGLTQKGSTCLRIGKRVPVDGTFATATTATTEAAGRDDNEAESAAMLSSEAVTMLAG